MEADLSKAAQVKVTSPQAGPQFDNLMKAFDITDVQNVAEKPESKKPEKARPKKAENKVNGGGDHVDTTKSHVTVTAVSSSFESPGSLKIDESRADNGTSKMTTPKMTQKKATKAQGQAKGGNKCAGKANEKKAAANNSVPVVTIKEEKEDPGYNKAMKNVITLTTPSPVVTTTMPVSGMSLIQNSMLVQPTASGGQKTLLLPRSMIATSSGQMKIAPRPAVKSGNNAPKFAFIPVTNPGARGQTSKTVTLYVPPNLLNTPGVSGGLRFASPQSLVELLHRSGSVTSQAGAKPAAVNPAPTAGQAPTQSINPQTRMTTQVATNQKANKQPASVRLPAVSLNSIAMLNQASRDLLLKMVGREHMGRRHTPTPPPDLELGTLPKQVCPCGDEFLTQAGLDNHTQRKSTIIRFQCNSCPCKEQVFDNPCVLIGHLQSHGRSLSEALNSNMVCQVLPIGKSYSNLPLDPNGDSTDLSKEDHRKKTPASKASVVPPKTASKVPSAVNDKHPSPVKMVPVKESSTSNSEKDPSKTKDSANEATEASKKPAEKADDVQMAEATEPKTGKKTDKEEPEKVVTCPYCRVVLDNEAALEQHFQTATPCQTEELQDYTCQQCSRILPNPCSFQAHQALHNKSRPFVCPECGLIVNGTVRTYVKHCQDKCMHDIHQLRFGCTKCPAKKKKKFSSRQGLLEHIEDHGETYVKCLHCPMAFRSMDTLKDHCEKTHTITDITETDYKSIFKCALCDTVYQEADQRRTHLMSHNRELKVFLVYRCNVTSCMNRVFITKVRTREHMQERHQLRPIINMCDICGADFETTDLLKEHQNSKHSDPNKCVVCGEVCADQESLWKHLEDHDKLNNETDEPVMEQPPHSPTVIRKRKLTESSSSPASKKVKSPPYVPSCQVEAEEDSRFYCSDCKLKFLRQGVLQEHMRIVHSVRPQFPCHLCGATYDSHSKLQKHVKQHEGKAREHVHYMCWICQKNKNVKVVRYTKRSILEKHLTGYHKLNKSNIDWTLLKPTSSAQSEAGSEGEGEGLELDAVEDEPIKRLKVDGDTEFTCAKCTFVCENRDEFLSHIPQHKTEDESHQCQECGMCFMVLPSLKRHLLIVHRIRDFMKYFQESGLNLDTPPAEDRNRPARPKFPINGNAGEAKDQEEPSKDPDTPGDCECKVCYKHFDSEKGLHNHMRVHGMAFIKSKRMEAPI